MQIRRAFMATGVAAMVACLPLFGTSGAMLSPMAGTVAVNGQTVTAGSAVVAGDLVSTSAAGSARMVLPGGSVIAASNTQFRMESVNGANQIRLNRGLVKVTGLLPVALNTRTVVPSAANARFNVYDLSGTVYVEALSGTVAVKTASSAYTVATGTAVSFPDPQAGAGAGASASASAGGMSTGLAIGLVVAIAAGAGYLIYQANQFGNTGPVTAPVSPSS